MYRAHFFEQSPRKFENEPRSTKISSKFCFSPTYSFCFFVPKCVIKFFFKQLCTGKSLPSPFLAGPFRPFGPALRKGLDLGSSVVVKTAEISTWASSWKPMPARATMSSKLPESSRRCGACGACGARHRNWGWENDIHNGGFPGRKTVWYDNDMIWYDMIWYDMIWYDMIWYDMIWYDMIWYVWWWKFDGN